jgi:dTDP-glucose pyrophosphorylase
VINDIPKNKVYNITDLINDYLVKGKEIGVYPISEKSWLDMGQLEEYQKSIKIFGIQ